MASFPKKWSAKQGKGFTHLLLDGGKLWVDDASHSLFLSEYANAVAGGATLRIVETKTPVFRLFADFDFKGTSDETLVDSAIKAASGVAGYYFDATSRAVVLRKDVDTPDKIGVHMTWDSIFVTPTVANAFRSHLVRKLDAAHPGADWGDVVDPSVYGGSGLRMPWSSKVDAPGVYSPRSVCSPDGTLEVVAAPKTARDYREWIRTTCIRTPDQSPTPTCIVTSEIDDSQQQQATSHMKTLPERLADHEDVLRKIQGTLPSVYDAHKFTSMHRFGDHCVVLRSDSRRCGNKSHREHAKSTVYFVVLRKGYAYQRCYCRKDVVRDGGVTCRDYVSDYWTIPEDVIRGLWPPVPKETADLMALLAKTRPVLKKRRKAA